MKSNKIMVPIIILFILILIPCGNAITILHDQETTKSGDPGSEVVYTIDVKNDRPYPVDIKGVIHFSDWKATIDKDEYTNVLPNEIVTFTVTVEIPGEPDNESSETRLDLSERPSTGGLTRYSTGVSICLSTIITQQEEEERDYGMNHESASLIMMVGVILFAGAVLFYFYYNRANSNP